MVIEWGSYHGLKLVQKLILFILIFGFAEACFANTAESLNQFYRVKQTHPEQATKLLQDLLVSDPNNLTVQLENGYWLLNQKQYQAALPFFQKSRKLAPKNQLIALQLGYILNALGQNHQAYQEFKFSATSDDIKIRRQSQQAMLNLAGFATRVAPPPFFADIYFAPYYNSRLAATIFPLQTRAGLFYGHKNRGELYVSINANKDTRSTGGQNPIIYSDNSVVYALGTRYRLWNKPQIYAYTEWGKAHYLLNDKKTATDFRAGLVGSLNWGETPSYADQSQFSFKHVGDVYANLSFYSRFENNWIGQLTLHEGARIFNYHYSTVDVYGKLQLFADSRKVYYNNLVEFGPGLRWKPDNRYNFALRLEAIHGNYLPINASISNPYQNNYNAVLAMLETYWCF